MWAERNGDLFWVAVALFGLISGVIGIWLGSKFLFGLGLFAWVMCSFFGERFLARYRPFGLEALSAGTR